MKFALLLLGFGTTSAQDDWEFANKLENPNLSSNLNDIVSFFSICSPTEFQKRSFCTKITVLIDIYDGFFSSDQHRKSIN